MNNLNKSILALATLLIISSCDNKEKQILYSEVRIPELNSIFAGKDSIIPIPSNKPKIIIFHDSLECGTCRISHLYEWDHIINYSRQLEEKFIPVFIFAPSKRKIKETKLHIKSKKISYAIYLDENNLFLKNNPHISKNRKNHTFLLDENNKIILIGNPIGNDRLASEYIKEIQKLTNNSN